MSLGPGCQPRWKIVVWLEGPEMLHDKSSCWWPPLSLFLVECVGSWLSGEISAAVIGMFPEKAPLGVQRKSDSLEAGWKGVKGLHGVGGDLGVCEACKPREEEFLPCSSMHSPPLCDGNTHYCCQSQECMTTCQPLRFEFFDFFP